MKYKRYFLICILSSLLSSLKISFLPEIQILSLMFLFLLRDKMLFGFALVVILSSHHYAIPDEVYRFDASNYPSIYTKKIGAVKLLDLLVLFFFLFSFFNFKKRKLVDLKISTNFPFQLFLFCLFGMLTMSIENQDLNLALFNLRSIIMLISTIMLFQNFNSNQLITFCYIAIVSWVSKMFFSIIIPAENPLYREIFGFKWNIFFAGDEYLTLGIYFISILLLKSMNNQISDNKGTQHIKILILTSLVLALISQRKGALIYFFVIYTTIFFYGKKGKRMLSNLIIIFLPLSTFIFLIFLLPLLPDYISLLFYDQLGLLNSSLDSIKNLYIKDPLHFLFGIGPYSYYEVVGLDPLLDNEMAFGSEVGNRMRYMIWSLPFGRLFLNVGLFGAIIYCAYLIKNLRMQPYYFYLYSSILPIFFLDNFTPVSALSIGIGFISITKYRQLKCQNN